MCSNIESLVDILHYHQWRVWYMGESTLRKVNGEHRELNIQSWVRQTQLSMTLLHQLMPLTDNIQPDIQAQRCSNIGPASATLARCWGSVVRMFAGCQYTPVYYRMNPARHRSSFSVTWTMPRSMWCPKYRCLIGGGGRGRTETEGRGCGGAAGRRLAGCLPGLLLWPHQYAAGRRGVDRYCFITCTCTQSRHTPSQVQYQTIPVFTWDLHYYYTLLRDKLFPLTVSSTTNWDLPNFWFL